jgi:esterase
MTSLFDAAGTDGHVRLDGLSFHYVRWGEQSLPALVCLHGLRSYARTFEPLAAALHGRMQVVALDQRGRGETEWDSDRQYYTDRYVSDLQGLVDHLGLERFHLLGHSMGGITSIVYAGGQPSRLLSVVLEDSGPGASTGSAGAARINDELACTPTVFADWAQARAFWRLIRPNVTEAAIESRVANSMREEGGTIRWIHDQAGIAECRLHPDPARVTPDLWPFVERIAVPGLVLRGGDSDYLSRETLARMLECNPGLRGCEIPGAGHYMHDDQPDAFHAAVTGFLSGLELRP